MRIAEWEKLGIADWETSEAQKIVDLRDPDQSGIADCEMRIAKWEKLGIADWRLAKLKKNCRIGGARSIRISQFPLNPISPIPQSAFRNPKFPLNPHFAFRYSRYCDRLALDLGQS